MAALEAVADGPELDAIETLRARGGRDFAVEDAVGLHDRSTAVAQRALAVDVRIGAQQAPARYGVRGAVRRDIREDGPDAGLGCRARQPQLEACGPGREDIGG